MTRSVLAAVVALAFAIPAFARPTHTDIRPLPAATEIDGLSVYPLDVGRVWTYRDSTGRKSSNMIRRSATPLDPNAIAPRKLWTRETYDLPPGGEPKLIERWLFAVDPQRGVLSLGGEETSSPHGLLLAPEPDIEMPQHLTADSAWVQHSIQNRFVGVADVEVEAGSFKGCAVVEATKEHRLPLGQLADTRTFYCPHVGRVLVLVMVQGRWAAGLELVSWSVLPPEAHKGRGAPTPP